MKFLADAQLPKTLADWLNQKGFDTLHTLDLANQNQTSDAIITELAIQQNRTLVTKDKDFLESFLLHAKPTKLILVRTGNLSNKELLNLFNSNIEVIESMLLRSNLIEITSSDITEHE